MTDDQMNALLNRIQNRMIDLTILHCVAAYPTPASQMNLSAIKYPGLLRCGLSDHSGDLLTGALAVACGAEIIEVHFRLDETRKDNADFAHSHDPWSLGEYVAAIRKAELMLGDGVKKIEACERDIVKHRVLS
jgi:sialic acid synthase SpsE